MKEALITVITLLTLFVGGLVGYSTAVDQVHKEAVANGAGRWVATSQYGSTFVWNAPRN